MMSSPEIHDDGGAAGAADNNILGQGEEDSTSQNRIRVRVPVQVFTRGYYCYQCDNMFSTRERVEICATCSSGCIEFKGVQPSIAHEIREVVLPANAGDYYYGPQLDAFAESLSINDSTDNGLPPASKYAIEALLDVKITKELMESENTSQCVVCQERYELGESTKQMPCNHVYHPDCIVSWLELHNSCPICRCQLSSEHPNCQDMMNMNREKKHESAGNASELLDARDNPVGSNEGPDQPILGNWRNRYSSNLVHHFMRNFLQ